MIFDKASEKDIDKLVELRLAYLQEDLGEISEQDMHCLKTALPQYFGKHLNHDLFVYVARNMEEICACAFLLVVEKPMSPAFITGKTGTVLNVYTRQEYRKQGYAKQLMNVLLEDAKANALSVIELKATEDGYHLYKTVGFEDVVSKYYNMRFTFI